MSGVKAVDDCEQQRLLVPADMPAAAAGGVVGAVRNGKLVAAAAAGGAGCRQCNLL
jgi:hypothetical protein